MPYSTTLEFGTPAPSFVLPDVRTRETVRREDFTDADAVLAGEPVPPDQKPSTGCGIEWKPGNQPGA